MNVRDSLVSMRNPESQAWRTLIPPEDTAPPEIDAHPLPDPTEWGVTAEEARNLLRQQMCPICGEGPWKSPLNHVSRKHGIDRHSMRDVCLLSENDKVTDEEARAKWAANGTSKIETLRANSARARGNRRTTKPRMTGAFRASIESNPLQVWIDDNPEKIARLRAGFRDRMTTPEARAKWEEAMERVRDEREWTDEERESFRQRMNSPEVQARRQSAQDAARTEGCSVNGCPRPHVAKGYCRLHWRKDRQYGSPSGKGRVGSRPKLSPEQMEQACSLYASGLTQDQVAARLGVTQSIISRVIRGDYVTDA